MIQLPNDDALNKLDNKKDWILRKLKKKNMEDNKIAIWLDREKTDNLANITDDNSDVDILLFKQAPSTGWDCPRAKVLLMYREIKDPVFQAQVLGRIMRIPPSMQNKADPSLKLAYLYTNYTKSQIIEGYKKFPEGNKPKIYHSQRKEWVEPLIMQTHPSQRFSYNDLGKSFQPFFCEIAEDIMSEDSKEQLRKQSQFVQTSLITDLNISDTDDFIAKLKRDEETEVSKNLSYLDVEKIYNKLCVEILRDAQTKFTNIARSWEPLKMAINVYVERLLITLPKIKYYPKIVNDLADEQAGVLRPLILKALKKYEGVRQNEEKIKAERLLNMHKISVPPDRRSYTSDHEEHAEYRKSAMMPFYENPNKAGYRNEESFIKYLENHPAVIWWYKNGDSGSEFFSILKGNNTLFYPDFLIETARYIWIIDTKAYPTLQGEEPILKAEALGRWLVEYVDRKNFRGGIVKLEKGFWKIARDSKLQHWTDLKLE